MAQARLTPLAKILISVIILGLFGTAAWHCGLKNAFSGGGEVAGGGTGGTTGAPAGGGTTTPAGGGASGSIGSPGNPLKVSLVSFHGYAPALLANGRSLTTQPGSIFARAGVNVQFVIQDDLPTLATIFESGAAHCAWRTSDFWAQEQPNLRNAGLDARAIVIVDNTQGADAVIARDASVQRIEDLVGKRVALLQYTPSHGMLVDAIENSSLTARQRTQIQMVFINADEGTAGVRAAFNSGQVDAAVLWDPDLSLAVRATPGSHVVYSTRSATNLIYDLIVCDQRVLQAAANRGAIQGFVRGWLEGVDAAQADHAAALDALVRTEEFFALLAREQGNEFVTGLFANLVWTGLDDNARILGLAGGTNYYENVYRRFDRIYREAGALANPNSPVIAPQDSFDYQYVRALIEAQPQVREEAQRPQFTFTNEERTQVAETTPEVTRPVDVHFASGSFELTRRSQQTIDQEMVPLIESHGSAYIEVSGNTDSTGTRAVNQRLSQQRAQAVVDYLITQWEFPRERFVVVGNGSAHPLCNERAPEEGMTLEQCQERNRTTRAAVLARQDVATPASPAGAAQE
jgi:NitT/TauT family transport system substrate-binding protein